MCGFSERKGPDFHKLAKLLGDLGWVQVIKDVNSILCVIYIRADVCENLL